MRKDDYKIWVKQFLKNASPTISKNFIEIVDLPDKIERPSVPLRHHIESSFNNRDRFSLIKLIHIFHYPDDYQQKTCQEIINTDFLIKLLTKINKFSSTNYNVKVLDFLFSIPLSAGQRNDVIALSFDLNLPIERLEKISLHLKPYQNNYLFDILQYLKIKIPVSADDYFRHLEFVGIDFFPTGKCCFKTYQVIERLPKNLNTHWKKILPKIFKQVPRNDIFLMTRFTGQPFSLKENIYFYLGHLKQAQQSEFMKSPLIDFLRWSTSGIRLKLIWLALKDDKKMEVYFC